MMKNFNLFQMALVLMMTLTACGKKTTSSAAADTPGAQAALNQALDLSKLDVAKLDTTLKCKNPAPLTPAPTGATEIQVDALKLNVGMMYRLVQVETHAVAAFANGKASSMIREINISYDETTGTPIFDAKPTCLDIQPNDSRMVFGRFILAFNSQDGMFNQMYTNKLMADGNTADHVQNEQMAIPTLKKARSFYNVLAKMDKDRVAAQAKGQDESMKFYKNAAGDIEWRKTVLGPMQENGSREWFNELYRYTLVQGALTVPPTPAAGAATTGAPTTSGTTPATSVTPTTSTNLSADTTLDP